MGGLPRLKPQKSQNSKPHGREQQTGENKAKGFVTSFGAQEVTASLMNLSLKELTSCLLSQHLSTQVLPVLPDSLTVLPNSLLVLPNWLSNWADRRIFHGCELPLLMRGWTYSSSSF